MEDYAAYITSPAAFTQRVMFAIRSDRMVGTSCLGSFLFEGASLARQPPNTMTGGISMMQKAVSFLLVSFLATNVFAQDRVAGFMSDDVESAIRVRLVMMHRRRHRASRYRQG